MMNADLEYQELLTGGGWTGVCPLHLTDAYKLSMAQAGFPLRTETFYLSFRKPGDYLIPFNFKEVILRVLGHLQGELQISNRGQAYLATRGYGLTPAMVEALKGNITVWAAPKGSWVKAKEPIVTITGPSFLVSWFEPLVIMFNFPIQIATALAGGQRDFKATCENEAGIIQLVKDELGITEGSIQVMEDDYRNAVRTKVAAVVAAVGNPERIFEVGFRSASCLEQHTLIVEECVRADVLKTSNIALAQKHEGIPVGTTGHEHQQRWGNDLDGFRAIRDMRPGMPSYLFDTFDALRSGIPAAIQVLREENRPAAVRFDSGDQDAQLALFVAADVKPTYIFEDGYTPERAEKNENLCESYNIPRFDRLYGFGGFLGAVPSINPYIRDRVQAVYKLCKTGERNVMKHAGTKSSVPGTPVILRGHGRSIIAQLGEIVPGFLPLGENPGDYKVEGETLLSEKTAEMVSLEKDRLHIGY